MDLNDRIFNNPPSPFVKAAQSNPRKVQTFTILSKRFIGREDIVALGGTLMVLSFQDFILQLSMIH